jgi:peptidoglycan/xylan/chitin deacetylase (PgdA/CDA1 family)
VNRWLNRSRDLLFLPGTGRYWAGKLKGKVMILVYHRVSSDPGADFLDQGGVPRIASEQLQQELRFLAELGARFLTLADLRAGEYPGPDQFSVVVTFDDGFRDSYEQGLPIVESVGGRAVIFQCTQMLGAETWLTEHRVYRWIYSNRAMEQSAALRLLKEQLSIADNPLPSTRQVIDYALSKIPHTQLSDVLDSLRSEPGTADPLLYPDEQMLRSAVAAGHEIGSHGHRHLHRGTISEEQFAMELSESRGRLEEVLGSPPAAFSFPFGASIAGDGQLCQQYFSQAVSCERSPVFPTSNPFWLGRYSWPGVGQNPLRRRRWLLTGSV